MTDAVLHARAAPVVAPVATVREAFADNLKTLLVAGVIVAHVAMAWTDIGTWVFDEPPVREPLLSLLMSVELVGALFGMALFFFVAGYYSPPSLARKGTRRFLADRTLRLGVPMAAYVLLLSPLVEWGDPDAKGWDRGFPAFVVQTWRDFVPGPTWFLGVLLLYSFGYGAWRAVRPARTVTEAPRARLLVVAAVFVAVASYVVRLALPLGEEYLHLALAQAPAWVTGFVLGVAARERGWFERITPATSRGLFRAGWMAVVLAPAYLAFASGSDFELDLFGGGGTWQSLVTAVIESVIAVAMTMWLFDVFRRRANHQGAFARAAGRAAFAAFVVHQLVLVWLVLLSHSVSWPPEAKLLAVAVLGLAGSFGLGALLTRVPGVRRFT